jgi:hypothetical protein
LGIEHVDRSHLHTISPTRISQLGGIDVVSPIRYDQGESGEPIDNGLSSLWVRESLKKLLEDQACGENRFAGLKGLFKPTNLGTRGWSIST